jgi:S1-C subfamily serine protease
VPLLTLGAIVVFTLFLALQPLRLETPAWPSSRALMRFDRALRATVERVDPEMERTLGLQPHGGYLVVTSVARNGPAAAAGLQVGDVIERINGRPATVLDADHLASSAPMSIQRDGKEQVVSVEFKPDPNA